MSSGGGVQLEYLRQALLTLSGVALAVRMMKAAAFSLKSFTSFPQDGLLPRVVQHCSNGTLIWVSKGPESNTCQTRF